MSSKLLAGMAKLGQGVETSFEKAVIITSKAAQEGEFTVSYSSRRNMAPMVRFWGLVPGDQPTNSSAVRPG